MFFRRPQYFPKQLFLRFLRQQILGVVPALIAVALLTRIYLATRLSNFHSTEEVVAAYDRAFLFLALVMAASVSGISVYTAYRLVLPLGRMLVKARGILKREYAQAPKEDLTGDDGQGEWSDLETTLHRIGKDMHKKEQTLSREREQIEAIISAISEAVVAVDRQGNLLFYNSQFAVLFDDLHRRQSRLSDFFRNPDVLETFRHTLKSGEPSSVNTRLRIKGEQSTRHFSLSVSTLKTENGEIYGAVGVFHDVTELKRMDQVRIDFVANVSHELRTPLTSIKGYAQTVKEDVPEASRKYIETIERNTDRLIALVTDLLSISALESGAELERAEVDLEELTGRVAGELRPKLEAKQQDLSVSVETPVLWADANRLEQVVFNLLENGIKYVPAAGEIRLRWFREGHDIVLSVKDNRPGIPAEHHSRIFERFYRVDSARTREQGGTGLGLSIVKHIVQRHGGRVKVQGGLGRGSEFLCYFPEAER
jgi:two-component system phosphate regulon sensor histidine kinase PhoR